MLHTVLGANRPMGIFTLAVLLAIVARKLHWTLLIVFKIFSPGFD